MNICTHPSCIYCSGLVVYIIHLYCINSSLRYLEYELVWHCCPIVACNVLCVYCSYITLSSLRYGCLSLCESLGRAKAEVNSKNSDGDTPLHLASRYVICAND